MPRAIYRQGFDGYLVREVTAGSKSRRPFPVTERRRRELREKKELTGGSRWQGVRGERGSGVGWFPGLARLELGPGHGPVAAFLSFFFDLVLFPIFCLYFFNPL
jgi:hypothetical protein